MKQTGTQHPHKSVAVVSSRNPPMIWISAEKRRLDPQAEAEDPQTSPARLRALAPDFPFEVAVNPNTDSQTLNDLAGYCVGAYSRPKTSFALSWAILEENPATQLLELENPRHPVLVNLRYLLANSRLEMAIHELRPYPSLDNTYITVMALLFEAQLPYLKQRRPRLAAAMEDVLLRVQKNQTLFWNEEPLSLRRFIHGNLKDSELLLKYAEAFEVAIRGNFLYARILREAILWREFDRQVARNEDEAIQWNIRHAEISHWFANTIEHAILAFESL